MSWLEVGSLKSEVGNQKLGEGGRNAIKLCKGFGCVQKAYVLAMRIFEISKLFQWKKGML